MYDKNLLENRMVIKIQIQEEHTTILTPNNI